VPFSSGEPLLHRDIAVIVKAVKQSDGTPYLIPIGNRLLLNKADYLQLLEAGVNQFSCIIDFADEFRWRPGLHEHLQQTLPWLARLRFRDTVWNTAITEANLKKVLPLAGRAV
jgi:MoaA/NifB/PqqE/SkfB family radical SAM enzyme